MSGISVTAECKSYGSELEECLQTALLCLREINLPQKIVFDQELCDLPLLLLRLINNLSSIGVLNLTAEEAASNMQAEGKEQIAE